MSWTTDFDQFEIPEDFQDGVAALQAARPDQRVEVAGEADNMLVVRVGEYRLSQFEPEYDEETVEVFARIMRTFPDWSGTQKGFLTTPPLQRTDGSLQNNPWNGDDEKEIVEEYSGVDDVECYSWKWSGVPMNSAEDMAYAHDLAKRMLRYG